MTGGEEEVKLQDFSNEKKIHSESFIEITLASSPQR